MLRIPVAAALLLGLVAAPAFAETEDEAAAARSLQARTLHQNQRAFVAPPAKPPEVRGQPAKVPAAAVPVTASRRLAAADQPRR